MINLLVFVLVIVVPFPIGYGLAHYWPQRKNLKNAAIAALPACLPFFGFALWVTLTREDNCVVENCDDMAQLWAMGLYVLGVMTAVTGFGVGLLGDSWARKHAEKKAGE